MKELISRSEARAKSLTKYFTGEPCRSGHIDERYVSTKNCRSCLAESDRKRYRAGKKHELTPEAFRKRMLWTRYRLTPEDFERMRQDQRNCCVICTLPFVGLPMVDHCHATGKVRGLLCHHCNILLGHAKDDPAVLSRAIAYLTGA